MTASKLDIQRRTWEIVEVAKAGDTASRIFDTIILTFIFLNVIAVIIDSVQSIQIRFGTLLYYFEIVSVAIFSVEYVARIWSCTSDSRYQGRFRGRIRFALKMMPLIDLLAILPFFLPFVGIDLRLIRVVRLLRIFRVAKLGRYFSSLNLIKDVFQSKKEELVLSSLLMVILLVISSTLLFYCENSVQSENFSSIPATMWWAVATLSTVGYGDIYPVSLLGKICASITAILGIGMFALPTGILGSGFVEIIKKKKEPQKKCPYCGKEIT